MTVGDQTALGNQFVTMRTSHPCDRIEKWVNGGNLEAEYGIATRFI